MNTKFKNLKILTLLLVSSATFSMESSTNISIHESSQNQKKFQHFKQSALTVADYKLNQVKNGIENLERVNGQGRLNAEIKKNDRFRKQCFQHVSSI
jgi:hypothetical protein